MRGGRGRTEVQDDKRLHFISGRAVDFDYTLIRHQLGVLLKQLRKALTLWYGDVSKDEGERTRKDLYGRLRKREQVPAARSSWP